MKWRPACGKKDASLVFFEAKDALKRLEKKGDLFAPVLTLKQNLKKALKSPIPT